ncbi:hypothetical protein [Leptolyngbya iicbica]|uniref:Uncharacterized protein n=2 Tax=Cyanophyceae TaxID=3028117 RepID=A0A4Q7E4C7_9CYAN|nr:hypothetical protein [Leptolyngbya sp. LK]RZM76623.1 hypothetical protein DYY88_18345 [Leptolyngbya sp. LK]
MATTKRTVYLISEQQRNALLNYLQDRPYREVAAGIQLLLNAPTAKIDVELPDDAPAEAEASEATVEEASTAA